MTIPNNFAHMAYDAFAMASRMNMPPYQSIGPAQMHWLAVAVAVADAERERIVASLRDWASTPGAHADDAARFRRIADLIDRGELWAPGEAFGALLGLVMMLGALWVVVALI